MLKNKFYTSLKEFFLPPVPAELEDKIHSAVANYVKNNGLQTRFTWMDYNIDEINQWAWKNISPDVYFGIQIITDEGLGIHQDQSSHIKLLYYLDTGGNNVTTTFYADPDGKVILESHVIPAKKWFSFDTQVWHDVKNVESLRYALVATVNYNQREHAIQNYK